LVVLPAVHWSLPGLNAQLAGSSTTRSVTPSLASQAAMAASSSSVSCAGVNRVAGSVVTCWTRAAYARSGTQDEALRLLRVLKGNYELDVTIASNLGGLKTARAVAEKAVAKIP
jgi:hypothetical protein